jgi:hypothetical protein
MDKIDDGGPAFPTQNDNGEHWNGMSMREWFAGMALQGIIAGKSFTHGDLSRMGLTHQQLREAQIKDAYTTADAMLEARGGL